MGLVKDTNMAAVSLFWDTGVSTVTSCENTLMRMCINLFSRACVHWWKRFSPNRQVPLCGSAGKLSSKIVPTTKRTSEQRKSCGYFRGMAGYGLSNLSKQLGCKSRAVSCQPLPPAEEGKTCFLTRSDSLLQTTPSGRAFVHTSKESRL